MFAAPEMESKPKKPNAKRRAIIQGSLAAPMVLTVSSAGATAALSSSARALQHLKDQQPPKSKYFEDSPDNWFRRPVKVVKLKYKAKDDKKAFSNLVPEDDWFYLDPGSNRYYKLSTMEQMAFGAVLPSDWEETKEKATRYLLVWVDPDTGQESLKMLAEPSSGHIACTCSAIRSVNPGARCEAPTGNRV